MKKYGDGFIVIGVSLDTDPKALTEYLRENGFLWPQLWEEGGLAGPPGQRDGHSDAAHDAADRQARQSAQPQRQRRRAGRRAEADPQAASRLPGRRSSSPERDRTKPKTGRGCRMGGLRGPLRFSARGESLYRKPSRRGGDSSPIIADSPLLDRSISPAMSQVRDCRESHRPEVKRNSVCFCPVVCHAAFVTRGAVLQFLRSPSAIGRSSA